MTDERVCMLATFAMLMAACAPPVDPTPAAPPAVGGAPAARSAPAAAPCLVLARGPHRLVPEIQAGKPAGWRIFGVRAGGELARAGVRERDVVAAIDGEDPSLRLGQCLEGKTLTIRRGGREMLFKYPQR